LSDGDQPMQEPASAEAPAARSAVNTLRDRLRTSIVSGELPAGAVRTQSELADALGVSRTPLREALRMLELEQLITRKANGRFRVADFSLDEIEQLGVMRLTLEAAAVRLTVPSLTNADHAELEGLLAQTARLSGRSAWDEFEAPHLTFHMRLTGAVGPMYSEQLRRLWGRATRYRRAYAQLVAAHGRQGTSQREHRAILDAAEAYDADVAAGCVAVQYARTAIEIAAEIDPDFPMDRVRCALEVETGSRELPAI
jgi:DNA-binding GntR family transcriptional regulator